MSKEAEEGKKKKHATEAAVAPRILIFLWNIAGFMKHKSSVEIAIVAGIAQKLNMLWFFKILR